MKRKTAAWHCCGSVAALGSYVHPVNDVDQGQHTIRALYNVLTQAGYL
jgi:hypothetical protein